MYIPFMWLSISKLPFDSECDNGTNILIVFRKLLAADDQVSRTAFFVSFLMRPLCYTAVKCDQSPTVCSELLQALGNEQIRVIDRQLQPRAKFVGK